LPINAENEGMEYELNQHEIQEWRELIQFELSELEEWQWKNEDSHVLSKYAEAMIAYLCYDTERLKPIVTDMGWMNAFIEMRLKIRTRDFTIDTCQHFAQYLERHKHDFFYAEGCFILALAFDNLRDHRRMRDWYRKAGKSLEKDGCYKKAIKAYQNALAAETRIYPDKHFIRQHCLIYKKAKAVGAKIVMGTTLANIAREYQKLGAFHAGLKYAQLAVNLYEDAPDSREYFHALLQRAELLVLLERILEAKVDLDMVKIAKFPEIQEALRTFEAIYFGAANEINVGIMAPAWQERAQHQAEERSRSSLSPKEEKLITILAKGKKDKFQIIEALYPDEKDIIKLENRLNNVLNRLRKKLPGLVHFDGKNYFLSDQIVLKKAS
jgi:hypothetical protein